MVPDFPNHFTHALLSKQKMPGKHSGHAEVVHQSLDTYGRSQDDSEPQLSLLKLFRDVEAAPQLSISIETGGQERAFARVQRTGMKLGRL